MQPCAILTGSHAYGYVTQKSDIDLVVLLDFDTLLKLTALADSHDVSNIDGIASLRFGSLNLICVDEERIFETWVEGTNTLIKRKPVERAEAVALFTHLRATAKGGYKKCK